MKNIFPLILFLLFNLLVQGQKLNKEDRNRSLAFHIDSPVFFKNWGNSKEFHIIGYLEYCVQKTEISKTIFSLGFGKAYDYSHFDQQLYSYNLVSSEINWLFGKRNHYFETGIGLCYPEYIMINVRLGYRYELFDKWLIRVAYTPYILIHHLPSNNQSYNNASIGIGYKFLNF